jgi:hypothetical protein
MPLNQALLGRKEAALFLAALPKVICYLVAKGFNETLS